MWKTAETPANKPSLVRRSVATVKKVVTSRQPSFAEVWIDPLVEALDFTQYLPAACGGDDSYKTAVGSPFPSYSFFCLPVEVQFDTPRHQQLLRQAKSIRRDVATGITINGYPINDTQVKWFATNYKIHMRNDTDYWYDYQSGFFGRVGGKAKHVIDPELPIKGTLHPRSSGGDTGITINGREIHSTERGGFLMYGVKFQRGERYTIDPDGNVRSEGLFRSWMSPICNWKHMREQRMQQLKRQGYTLAQFMLNATVVVGKATLEVAAAQ